MFVAEVDRAVSLDWAPRTVTVGCAGVARGTEVPAII